MIFCEKCFSSQTEIQSMIRTLKKEGTCPTCNSNKVYICDTEYIAQTEENFEKDNVRKETLEGIKNIFKEILSIYSLKEYLPSDYPKGQLEALHSSLFYKWDIFNRNKISPAIVRDIVLSLLPDKYIENPDLFDDMVGVKELAPSLFNPDLMIIRNDDWNQFTETIKYKNRFHGKQINLENLSFFLSYFEEIIPANIEFFRCRINNENLNFEEKDLKSPPKGMATAGRLNAEGISRLYLCSEEETAISEVRASRHDIVTIGKFRIKEKLRILDLTNFDQIRLLSGFSYIEFLKYFLNMEGLKKISNELAKPVRSSDKAKDYLATQYISDFVKSILDDGVSFYQGIKYRSTASESGYNLMLFDDYRVELVNQETKSINYVKYIYG